MISVVVVVVEEEEEEEAGEVIGVECSPLSPHLAVVEEREEEALLFPT